MGELGQQMELVRVIGEYVSFKNECTAIVTYIASIEYFDLGTVFKDELETAKASFRKLLDDISESTSGVSAAQTVISTLTQLKEKYIERYFEEHKKKRLDIAGAKRRGKLQESLALANLRKLRSIEILFGAKLAAIEQDESDLKVCYELTTTELKTSSFCPHCGSRIGDKAKNVASQLDFSQKGNKTRGDFIMIIRKEIDLSKPLTSEQMKMLNDMELRPVQPVEGCPELTAEQFVRFAEAAREHKKRIETMQTVAIRLSPQALNKAKSVGESK